MTSVDIPGGLKRAIDEEVQEGIYKNKSELIRDAIRKLLEEKGKIENRRLSEKSVRDIKRARKGSATYSLENLKKA